MNKSFLAGRKGGGRRVPTPVDPRGSAGTCTNNAHVCVYMHRFICDHISYLLILTDDYMKNFMARYFRSARDVLIGDALFMVLIIYSIMIVHLRYLFIDLILWTSFN